MQSIKIDIWEVVILLIIYPIEYVFQTKRLSVFYIITGINQSKVLTKHISYKCECKFDGRKSNSNQNWNNDKCRCECKNPEKHNACRKDYIRNPATCSRENVEYLASTFDDSVFMCDKIITDADSVSTYVPENVTSTASINSDDKKVRYKMDCYILHTVFLLVILLFIIAIICYH